MDMVIVAFEGEKNCIRIKECLEGAGAASCILCHTAAEVRRIVRQQAVSTVICGYKFPDGTAEALLDDLPPGCTMLLMAPQGLLDLFPGRDVFKLAVPATRSDLLASVHMLLPLGRPNGPARPGDARETIQKAKAVLMDRHGMTEEQAHRFLQKKSMDSGWKLSQTAQMVLDEL